MFQNATSFNQNIAMAGLDDGSDESYWYTANVTTMQGMFYGATSFNQNISNWNVSNVENMNNMFREANFNQDISEWGR